MRWARFTTGRVCWPMPSNRAPWWDRGTSAAGTYLLAVLFSLLAALNFALALGAVIPKSLRGNQLRVARWRCGAFRPSGRSSAACVQVARMPMSADNQPSTSKLLIVVFAFRGASILMWAAGAVILGLRHVWLAMASCLLLMIGYVLLAWRTARRFGCRRR